MDKEKQEQINMTFFNRLFFEFSSISNKKVNEKYFEKTNHIYCSEKENLWFARGEDENKYYYMFGVFQKSIRSIETKQYSIIIDFSKNEEFCDDCIGILTKTSIYFHKNNFIKKYPNFNFKDYEIKNLIFPSQYNKQIEAIEIGDIDKFINFLKKINENDSKVKIKQNLLDDETKSKMNLFLNAIESGKDMEHSLKIARISEKELNSWLDAAENKDEKYIDFYDKYYEFIYTGKSKTANDNLMNEYYELQNKNKTIDFGVTLPKKIKIKMNVFINAYKENRNLKYALKLSNLDKNLFFKWIDEGKASNNEYHKFYKEYESIRNNSKNKVNDSSTKNEKLMKEFIRLKYEGKTNKEIYEIIEIPRHLIKNWRNQGQMGNKKYTEFYEAYIIDNNPKPTKNVEKEKPKIIPTTIEKNTETPKRRCRLCGRKLHEKHKSDLCKRCLKKQYAVKILGEILSIVEPGIAFRKEDLEILNLPKIKIKDYIWTLKDFDLITEEKSKIILKDMDILNKFAKECDSKIIIKENTNKKLNKTCKTCGENLEISNFFKSDASEDGYEENCINCKKLINSAVFLKELIHYIDWESEFSIDDIKTNFQDPFILQGNIWNLTESDLIINNHETNTYTLTDKETGEKFIKKYYQEPKATNKKITDETPKIEPQTTPITKNKELTKQDQMKIVLKEMKKRKTRKEAAVIAKIPLYKITHWYNEGRNGFGEDNINFYRKLSKIENKIKPHTTEEIKKQLNDFLNVFKECEDKQISSDRLNIPIEEVENWIIFGKEDINPYNKFLKEMNGINNDIDEDFDIEEFNIPINATKRKIFLEYIRTEASIEKACEQASLNKHLINKWIIKGKEDIYPFNEFYDQYHKYNGKDIEIDYENEYKTTNNLLKRKQILEELEKGKSLEKACQSASIDINLVNIWIEKGKENIIPFNEFFNKYEKIINEYSEEKMLQDEYEKEENISKRSIFLKQYNNGKSEKEACQIAFLDMDLLNEWLDKGKNKEKPYIEFFNKYEKAKNNSIRNQFLNSENTFKRKVLLEQIKLGKSNEEACEYVSLDINLLNEWLKRGNRKPYIEFFYAYDEAKNNSIENQFSSIENISKRKVLLEQIKLGKSNEEACEYVSLDINLFKEWISKGKTQEEPYHTFYIKYNEIISLNKDIEEYKQSINDAKRRIFLDYTRNGYSIEKSGNQASLEEELLNKWLELGKNNISPFDEFYNQYIELTDNNFPEYKRKTFLKYIEEGYSKIESAEKIDIDINIINEWLRKGVTGKESYVEFLKSYNKSKSISKDNAELKIQNDIIKLVKNGLSLKDAAKEYEKGSYEKEILDWYEYGKYNDKKYSPFYENVNEYLPDFFDLIKDGYSIKIACNRANLDYDEVKYKISTQDDEFLYKLIEAKILNKLDDYPKINSNNDNKRTANLMNKIIKFTVKGYSNKQSCQIVDLPYETYSNWIQRGKNNLGDIYVEFYNKIHKINIMKHDIKDTLLESFTRQNILDRLPEKYNNIYVSYNTGFAWVEKREDCWVYTKSTDGITYNYSHEDIRELFNIVLKEGEIWGVVDIKKAKNTLKNPIITKLPKSKEKNEQDIFTPLSEQTKEKLMQNNQQFNSGFAWVTQKNNEWTYSNEKNDMLIIIHDENITRLFEKVKTQNLEWGVFNLENAIYSVNNNKIPDNNLEEELDENDILKLLPEDIESELSKYSKGNKSGFAWVNKIGNQWIYTRRINNENIEITDTNIYRLFEKVKTQNFEWGVRDLNKAKKTLENEEKPEGPLEIEKPNIEEYDILVPLPEEYESSFKSTKGNKSGFAWVNKISNQWYYARNIKGKHVQVKDQNIYNLHKKVISQNLIWGVRDLNKAKITLQNEEKPNDLEEIEEIEELYENTKVNVNYLTKTESSLSILIKGTIENNQLFSTLSKVNMFEEYITRILTNKINNEIDILIELDLDVNLIFEFEKEIEKLGWKIN